jgi:putative transposase
MIIEGGAVKPVRPPKPAEAGDKPKRPKTEKQRVAEARRRDAFATPPGYVRIKLLSADGEWRFSEPLKLRGRMKRLAGRLDMAPTLMLRGSRVKLSCPVQVRRPVYVTNAEFGKLLKGRTRWRLCAFDVGINTAVTAVIVDGTGTVIARTFLKCGRHNDQRDRVMDVISAKRSQSGSTMKGQPFCSKLYRRIEGLSLQAARELSSQLMAFATKYGAKVLACEDLKGWKPKGRGKRQRQRFHRFEHRKLVEHVRYKAEETGLRVLEVPPRGTSRWAFDGSGPVERSKENYSNATFASGKQYNADLNAACNIAARGLARILGIENPREKQLTESKSGDAHASGKSPSVTERMPLVLADVWNWARKFIANVQTSLETDGPTQGIA